MLAPNIQPDRKCILVTGATRFTGTIVESNRTRKDFTANHYDRTPDDVSVLVYTQDLYPRD